MLKCSSIFFWCRLQQPLTVMCFPTRAATAHLSSSAHVFRFGGGRGGFQQGGQGFGGGGFGAYGQQGGTGFGQGYSGDEGYGDDGYHGDDGYGQYSGMGGGMGAGMGGGMMGGMAGGTGMSMVPMMLPNGQVWLPSCSLCQPDST